MTQSARKLALVETAPEQMEATGSTPATVSCKHDSPETMESTEGKGKPKIDKDVLSPNEEAELADLEAKMEVLDTQIYRGQLDMAAMLRTIQTKKLYKAKYKSFATYVETRWDKTVSWAFKLIQHLNVCDVLTAHELGQCTLKESVLLAPLPEKDMVKAVKAANRAAKKHESPRVYAELEKEVFAIRGIAKDTKSKGVSAFKGKNYDGENMTAAEFRLALDFVQQFGGDWERAMFVLQQAQAQAELQAAEGMVQ